MTGRYLRLPGDTIGTYRIRRQLGAGVEGTVYLVNDTRDGSLGTLKLLRGRNMIEQAEHTARHYGALRRVASVKQFCGWGVVSGERGVGDRPWLAFDYVVGETLARGITLRRVKQPLGLLLRICDALVPVHRRGLAIGDFDRGRNVIVERGTGLIKFCDLDAGTPDQLAPARSADMFELLSCARAIYGAADMAVPPCVQRALADSSSLAQVRQALTSPD